MINAEVIKKGGNENNMSIIRRFTKTIRNSGILSRARSIRFHNRKQSKYIRKKETLKGISKRQEIEWLIKLGKMPENKLK